MGAQESCLRRPNDDVLTVDKMRVRYAAPVNGSMQERSLVSYLQDSLLYCGKGASDEFETGLTACTTSIGSSVYGLDAHNESDCECARDADTPVRVTSGSRLLSEYYSLMLDSDHHAFFINEQGLLADGAYLKSIPIINDYFAPERRRVAVARGRRHMSSTKQFSKRSAERCSLTTTFANDRNMSAEIATIREDKECWAAMRSLLEQDPSEAAPPRLDRPRVASFPDLRDASSRALV